MIASLRLQNFRSYTDASFEFGGGVNIIVGPNASGKTNLLEAVLMLARGTSYRAADVDMVRFGADWFRLDGQCEPTDEARTVKFRLSPRPVKSYEFAGKTYQRLTVQHELPVVLFEPNHLQLLHGAPELRRNYLDDILEQTVPGFTSFRRNYRRTLSQRNALLKRTHNPSTQELFPWNLRLSELGAVIARERAALCDRLAGTLKETYAGISATKSNPQLTYRPMVDLENYESTLLHKLERHTSDDTARGFTLYGPHREDFNVTLDGQPAGIAASRGETRSLVLALKIMELAVLQAARHQTPLLLLDDVFSELDGVRRRALTTYLERYQTFLTTTDADVVVKHFTTSTIIPIS